MKIEIQTSVELAEEFLYKYNISAEDYFKILNLGINLQGALHKLEDLKK